jgi:hypothetical protein
MDGPNVITWNFTNWVTIVLMAAVGFAIVRTVVAMIPAR